MYKIKVAFSKKKKKVTTKINAILGNTKQLLKNFTQQLFTFKKKAILNTVNFNKCHKQKRFSSFIFTLYIICKTFV